MSQQTQEKFALRAKVTMLERGLTVASVARAICHPRPTVSTAIHQGRFPKVLAKVIRELGL